MHDAAILKWRPRHNTAPRDNAFMGREKGAFFKKKKRKEKKRRRGQLLYQVRGASGVSAEFPDAVIAGATNLS